MRKIAIYRPGTFVRGMPCCDLATKCGELIQQYICEATKEQLSASRTVNMEKVARISIHRTSEVLMRKYGFSEVEVAKIVEINSSDNLEMFGVSQSLCSIYAANDTVNYVM